jgi:hypothetical protein
MTVILIYQTNAYHNFSSRELIGVATTEKKRDILIRRFLRNYLVEKPTRDEIDDAMEQIRSYGQTQCLSSGFDMEIDTETVETNTIVL